MNTETTSMCISFLLQLLCLSIQQYSSQSDLCSALNSYSNIVKHVQNYLSLFDSEHISTCIFQKTRISTTRKAVVMYNSK
jgi:hypothetical protein